MKRSLFRLFVRRFYGKPVIVSACRSPMGRYGGALSEIPGTELGSLAIRDCIDRVKLDEELIEEVIVGNCLTGGIGQNPSKIVSTGAGLSPSIPTCLVNKVCASGLKAVIISALSILSDYRSCVATCGFESMSKVPYYSWDNEKPATVSGIELDGLFDHMAGTDMIRIGDAAAEQWGVSRAELDEYAAESYRRAAAAYSEGSILNEMFQIELGDGSGSVPVTEDEQYTRVIFDKIPKLNPIYEGGTITAANCSPLSDGSSALVLMDDSLARSQGLEVLGEITGFADTACESEEVCTLVQYAIKDACESSGIDVSDVDFFEIHEPFAIVPVLNMRALDLDWRRVNIHGGSISLGHPLASTASRLVVSILNVLALNDAKIGVAATCNGGGEASAMVIQRP